MKTVQQEYYSARKENGLYVGTLDLRNPVTQKVLRYVNEAFAHQKDRGGYPYIYHLLYVAEHVDPDAANVALLHDAMEDQGATKESLLSLGISEKEVEAVDALTRKGGEDTDEGYFAYVNRIRETHPLAFKVKQADLLMNADLRRIKTITAKDIDRSFKYEAALTNQGAAYLALKKELGQVQTRDPQEIKKIIEGISSPFRPYRNSLILLTSFRKELPQVLNESQTLILLATLSSDGRPVFNGFTPSKAVQRAYEEVEKDWRRLLRQESDFPCSSFNFFLEAKAGS
jgi:(p)ppGpp synthase/HD superfamily hydrolase